MSLWAVSGTWKQIEMNGRVNVRVVREMGPSEAPLSRRLMLSGYELGADASLGPVLSAGESSTDELTQWEHHQDHIHLLRTIDRNPRSHQANVLRRETPNGNWLRRY